jgi:hypothetical protein
MNASTQSKLQTIYSYVETHLMNSFNFDSFLFKCGFDTML